MQGKPDVKFAKKAGISKRTGKTGALVVFTLIELLIVQKPYS